MITPEMAALISVWQTYLASAPDWQEQTKGVEPKATDCGPVYEVDSPLDRPDESFAIADMREKPVTGAHYHTNGETEIYFVLAGRGTVVVGGEEIKVRIGSVVLTPPDTAHFTISEDLVLAVVNTPPFEAKNQVGLTASNPAVGYDHNQFEALKAAAGRTAGPAIARDDIAEALRRDRH